MAGRPRLSPSPSGFRILAIAAGVLLVHGLTLDWLARHQVQPSLLQRVAEPMFTRVLQPEAPPPPVAVAAAAAAAPPRPAITGITATPSTPEGTPTVAAKPRKAREPEPPPAPAAEPGERLARQDAAEAAQPAEPEAPAPPEPATPIEAAQAPAEPASAPQAPEASSPPSSAPQTAAPPAAAASAPVQADALDGWPRDSRLSYRLTGQFRSGPLYGEAQVQWQRHGALYQARIQLDISLAGSRVMTSQGDVTPEGLVPRVYEEARGNRLRGVRLNEREVVLSDGRSLPRPPGVQDTASQFVELGHRFATGRETLAVGRPVQVWLARPGGMDLWTYDVVALERLKMPRYGEVEAFRLKPRPLPNPRGNITAEIWFAPTLQYLPVRIRVSTGEEGWVDLLVETIEQR